MVSVAPSAGGVGVNLSAEKNLGSLSISVPTQEVGAGGRSVSFAASEEERAGLARRFGLQAVLDVTVEGRLFAEGDGEFVFRGDIVAKVVQTCVVTLEPVENSINEPMALRFIPVERLAEPRREVMVDAEQEEETEGLAGDVVDLGPAVAEQFGVALDPYPRKPGAMLPEGVKSEGPGRVNPFTVLRNLGRRG
jgi:uncharacterized metal-binding protein YceD (DUF177 family)